MFNKRQGFCKVELTYRTDIAGSELSSSFAAAVVSDAKSNAAVEVLVAFGAAGTGSPAMMKINGQTSMMA